MQLFIAILTLTVFAYLCGLVACVPTFDDIRDELLALHDAHRSFGRVRDTAARAKALFHHRHSQLVALTSSGRDDDLVAAFRESSALGANLTMWSKLIGTNVIEKSESLLLQVA